MAEIAGSADRITTLRMNHSQHTETINVSDQIDYFRAIQQHRRDEHAEQKQENTRIICASGLNFRPTNNWECLIFRERYKPKVDFYPSTGRWREVGPSKRNYSGGAQKFLEWYASQKG